jgi:hypothetical protein
VDELTHALVSLLGLPVDFNLVLAGVAFAFDRCVFIGTATLADLLVI